MLKHFFAAKQKRYRQHIYQTFQTYTMVPRQPYLHNLELAERIRYFEGAIVECGVWKGGMIAGMAKLLGRQREYFLFDSFEGLPPAELIDGVRALKWQATPSNPHYHNNCKADYEEAAKAMELAGITNAYIYKGWFDQTLGQYPKEPIALLRLDADWYASTLLCLEHLFDYVVNDGIIIMDDYYTWDGCARAVHDFLSARSATARIYTYNNSVCWIKK
ncbi:TylF/MycF/NovP-related O-methyltransferase [Microscilla marina]|uniref:MtfB n=1 Tax=Microscilla marina ATCC 23134 TaxID=313606 RepID=A1ZLY3_MICM2|nr:TylF/MycF/NovP-related O-methyltransferase [Microscilla marina]EAY28515.1 MtfB [Microscilla marina ATCC 23134]